jgi:glycolate oxidase
VRADERTAAPVTEPALRALLDELRPLFPGERLVSHADQLFVYECDAQRFDRGQPLALVFPETTEEVRAAVKACGAHGVPFLPRGAGTGLSGGAVARGSVLISTARMDRIFEVDAPNRQAWVGRAPSRRMACTTRPTLRARTPARSAGTSPRTAAARTR